MREYSLQDTEYRKTVDLTKYKKLIEDCVFQVVPKVKLEIYKNRYTIDPDISKGDLIKIGRLIAHTELGQYCMIRPILFRGSKIREPEQPSTLEEKTESEQEDNIKPTTPTKKGRCR